MWPPTTPPQVTYSLTELGVDLAGPMTDLMRWFGRHGDELLDAQKRYDSQPDNVPLRAMRAAKARNP
jgi:DNA-binding HxlR family transcriptional regulator